MAATVWAGTGNFTYTNSTGGNVRVIINYFGPTTPNGDSTDYGIQISAGGATITSANAVAIGKNLGTGQWYASGSTGTSQSFAANGMVIRGSLTVPTGLPLEVCLATTQSISISKITGAGTAQYNILVIPENG